MEITQSIQTQHNTYSITIESTEVYDSLFQNFQEPEDFLHTSFLAS